jgi:hypothetical protein
MDLYGTWFFTVTECPVRRVVTEITGFSMCFCRKLIKAMDSASA